MQVLFEVIKNNTFLGHFIQPNGDYNKTYNGQKDKEVTVPHIEMSIFI